MLLLVDVVFIINSCLTAYLLLSSCCKSEKREKCLVKPATPSMRANPPSDIPDSTRTAHDLVDSTKNKKNRSSKSVRKSKKQKKKKGKKKADSSVRVRKSKKAKKKGGLMSLFKGGRDLEQPTQQPEPSSESRTKKLPLSNALQPRSNLVLSEQHPTAKSIHDIRTAPTAPSLPTALAPNPLPTASPDPNSSPDPLPLAVTPTSTRCVEAPSTPAF